MNRPPPAVPLLGRALILTLVAHGGAMLAMAGLLLPGMPGGPHAAAGGRAAYVVAHPWLWRAGWAAWQVTAASDLLLAVALVLTPWAPRTPAVLTLVLTLCALVPDQYGQARWTWAGVRLAADPAAYAGFERHTFILVAGWGAAGYVLAALGWTWCFAAAGVWSRGLTILSAVTWTLFAAATVVVFLPRPPAWAAAATSAGNAVAFVLLMVWLAAVTLRVRRREREARAEALS